MRLYKLLVNLWVSSVRPIHQVRWDFKVVNDVIPYYKYLPTLQHRDIEIGSILLYFGVCGQGS
jgi:hypothetical protein